MCAALGEVNCSPDHVAIQVLLVLLALGFICG
jgi:hypothetical protein